MINDKLRNIEEHLDKGEAFHKDLVLELLDVIRDLESRIHNLEEFKVTQE